MPITECIECSGKVSTNAKFCPHCGNTDTRKKQEIEEEIEEEILEEEIREAAIREIENNKEESYSQNMGCTLITTVIFGIICYFTIPYLDQKIFNPDNQPMEFNDPSHWVMVIVLTLLFPFWFYGFLLKINFQIKMDEEREKRLND